MQISNPHTPGIHARNGTCQSPKGLHLRYLPFNLPPYPRRSPVRLALRYRTSNLPPSRSPIRLDRRSRTSNLPPNLYPFPIRLTLRCPPINHPPCLHRSPIRLKLRQGAVNLRRRLHNPRLPREIRHPRFKSASHARHLPRRLPIRHAPISRTPLVLMNRGRVPVTATVSTHRRNHTRETTSSLPLSRPGPLIAAKTKLGLFLGDLRAALWTRTQGILPGRA
jgi:hypothetical protein